MLLGPCPLSLRPCSVVVVVVVIMPGCRWVSTHALSERERSSLWLWSQPRRCSGLRQRVMQSVLCSVSRSIVIVLRYCEKSIDRLFNPPNRSFDDYYTHSLFSVVLNVRLQDSELPALVPLPSSERFIAIAAGAHHSLALSGSCPCILR